MRLFVILALLHFNGYVNQLLVLVEQFAIRLDRLGLMGNDRNDCGKLARAYLPNVQIGNDGIPVVLNGATDLIGQVGGLRSAIQQDAAGVSDKAVGPNSHDDAASDADDWVEPGPSEEFTGEQRHDSCH